MIAKAAIGTVSIVVDQSSINIMPDKDNHLAFLGKCSNQGTGDGVKVTITIQLFDSKNNYIGHASSMVMGGKYVMLTETGEYTFALGANETGFFKVVTGNDFHPSTTVLYSFNYETSAFTALNASPEITGTPVFANSDGYPVVSGEVKNSSSSYLIYFTEIYMAIFDSSGKMVGLDGVYINGNNYDYGSGTTDSALYTSETGTFSLPFSLRTSIPAKYSTFFKFKEIKDNTKPEKYPPFGAMDTPAENSVVYGSIPVSGWALDDREIDVVEIYRETENGTAYIGTADFVEGARPDIAKAFPDYPDNERAGWGYLLLTNTFPGNGNGTFKLFAIARDKSGKSATLGSKTIICDNANSTRPFGAIDTPSQGGVASGKKYLNWGWALTPFPNMIPIDGSTMGVYVDGKLKGNPVYNLFREDISTLFPFYMNSSGPVGYYTLDTTKYKNGTHTIYWVVTDTKGNTSGIGSRYFTISNNSSSPNTSDYSGIKPKEYESPTSKSRFYKSNDNVLFVGRGYNDDSLYKLYKESDGCFFLTLHEMERVKICFENIGKITGGYLVEDNTQTQLPVGSTLDTEENAFYWTPGPGFIGKYRFIFFEKTVTETRSSNSDIELIIEIIPM